MKGYIYTMYRGADPGKGWQMTDPIFTPTPTVGACVPHIRRVVVPGDYIFCVSGQVPNVQQYIVGGLKVDQKINAITAYKRFPGNRMRQDGQQVLGNVIVDAKGDHHPLDSHEAFERRIEDYVVGTEPIVLETEEEVAKAREESIPVLSDLFGRTGQRIFDIIGRGRRLNESQIEELLRWMKAVKAQRA